MNIGALKPVYDRFSRRGRFRIPLKRIADQFPKPE